MKSGGESGGSLGGGFIELEHHVLCFSVVYAHMTALCPVLADIDHRLELRGGSGYKYHVVDIEEGSNPVEVVNGGDLREFEEWEFGSQFEDKFCDTDSKEGRAKSAAFKETVENFHFIFLVNKGMENPYTYTSFSFSK